MITPSRTSATRLSIVCETRVPSRTGNVSRIRPVRRARVIALAGSPRRAGRVADISTPIIVAEVTSRRRTGRLGSAARTIQYQEAARKKSESDHQRAGDQDPGEVGADDAFDDVVDADLLRGERGQADARGRRRRRARRGGRSGARGCLSAASGGSGEGSFCGGAGGRPSAGRRPSPVGDALGPGHAGPGASIACS